VSGDDEPIPPAPPLDESAYISDEEDTLEKVKRGIRKFGKDLKKGAGDVATESKKLAAKSKEKFDEAAERRRKKKAMKDPVNYPWGSHTVTELKEQLRNLGLTVSGKKNDLIDRIQSHYRAEIPTQDDGTPELMDNLVSADEPQAAPTLEEDIDSVAALSTIGVDEPPELEEAPKAAPEATTADTLEAVEADAELFQMEGDEQVFVYDPPRDAPKLKKKSNWRAKKVNSSINLIFGGMMFVLTLAILDYGFEMGLFGGDIGTLAHLMASKVIRPYGGMTSMEVASLVGLISIHFFMASLLYFSGRHPIAAGFLVTSGLLLSLLFRIYAGVRTYAFDELAVWGLLIFDLTFAIPFAFTCWVPALTHSELRSASESRREEFVVPMSTIIGDDAPEYFTDSPHTGEAEDDDMDEFRVSRPNRPRRRGSLGLYEGLFLIVSLVLWPLSLAVHFLLALQIPTRFGTWNIETEGILVLPVLYLLSLASSYIVYRYDREARDGPIYAKEKVAYQEQMDQFLGIKKAYYDLQAARLASSADDA
jgi:hypothetical protein